MLRDNFDPEIGYVEEYLNKADEALRYAASNIKHGTTEDFDILTMLRFIHSMIFEAHNNIRLIKSSLDNIPEMNDINYPR